MRTRSNIFKQTQYQRLAGLSVAHLYNLRKSQPYLRQRYTFEKNRPKVALIGIRKKPRANGEPGFIRIDTVHQVKQKGVYHINAVDEVTQFEVVCTAPKISEQYLMPVIEQLLDCFPFVIQGFHSDNGSEYIKETLNKWVLWLTPCDRSGLLAENGQISPASDRYGVGFGPSPPVFRDVGRITP